jgi:1-acyl-sn-glycerol-3-phosphate acyltransferase
VQWGFRFVTFPAGMKRVVLGLENIPKDTAVLYVSNHRSLADIPMAYITVPNLMGFVAKIEIKKAPFLSWWMVLVNCLFLDRSDMRAGMKMILDGIDSIKQGYSIFIAPEGTRNQDKELLPFKEGSLKIADKTNCPIIPVAISGTDDVFENSAPWIKRATCVIEYGTPIYPDQLTKEERKTMGAYCRDVITEMLKGHEQYLVNNPSNKKK